MKKKKYVYIKSVALKNPYDILLVNKLMDFFLLLLLSGLDLFLFLVHFMKGMDDIVMQTYMKSIQKNQKFIDDTPSLTLVFKFK